MQNINRERVKDGRRRRRQRREREGLVDDEGSLKARLFSRRGGRRRWGGAAHGCEERERGEQGNAAKSPSVSEFEREKKKKNEEGLLISRSLLRLREKKKRGERARGALAALAPLVKIKKREPCATTPRARWSRARPFTTSRRQRSSSNARRARQLDSRTGREGQEGT